MTQTFATRKIVYLTKKLSPGDVTFTANDTTTVTKGRIRWRDPNNKDSTYIEWVSFTGITDNGDGTYTYTGLTRDLSRTAVPATSLSTGKTFGAGSEGTLVAMHDQLGDEQEGSPPASFTTAQLAARTGKVLGENFFDSTQGAPVYWNGSQYIVYGGAGAIVNATTTSSGGVELATQAELDAGTDTGSVGPLSAQPSIIQKTIQKGSNIYVATSGTDTYTGGCTPALTAYTAGMRFTVKIGITNTTVATLNIDSLGAKSIKRQDGSALVAGDLVANTEYTFVYDGTNLQRLGALKATSADATTGTDTEKYMTPALVAQQLGTIAFSGAQARSAVQLNITTTPSAVPFASEDFDTGTYHDNVTNNSRLTIPATGKYRITFSAELQGGSATLYFATFDLRKNGSTVFTRNATTVNNASATYMPICLDYVANATAADYYEVYVSMSNVSASFVLCSGSSTNATYFSVERLF